MKNNTTFGIMREGINLIGDGVSKRIWVTMSNADWYTFDMMRSRGHLTGEIMAKGLAALKLRQYHEDSRASVAEGIEGFVFLRRNGKIKRPYEFLRVKGRFKRNCVPIKIFSIEVKTAAAKSDDTRYAITYRTNLSNGSRPEDEQIYYCTKLGKLIDTYILNHFGFEV